MSNHTVYRVEHELDGWGCFRKNYSLTNINRKKLITELSLDELYNRTMDLPSPNNDGIYDMITWGGDTEFCGCISLLQLTQWVTFSELHILIENGYNVLEITVSDYKLGDTQVVFSKRNIIKQKNINRKILNYYTNNKQDENI